MVGYVKKYTNVCAKAYFFEFGFMMGCDKCLQHCRDFSVFPVDMK